MKSVTEFPIVLLNLGLKAKNELTGENKTPEEISQSLGEKFKMEGDKLKHFNNAVDVAGQHTENLKRVLVISLAEGESVPSKGVKVEEHHYVPDFFATKKVEPAKKGDKKDAGRGGKGRGGGQNKGPKESPWGLSEEQKIEKKKAQAAAAVAARAGKPS